MDKIEGYREKIKSVLRWYKDVIDRSAQNNNNDLFMFDDESNCYTWLTVGWTAKRRLMGITVLIRIHEGKIWIEEDMTESGITNELVAAGVPKEDIVLAFHPPEMRQYTEFAAA